MSLGPHSPKKNKENDQITQRIKGSRLSSANSSNEEEVDHMEVAAITVVEIDHPGIRGVVLVRSPNPWRVVKTHVDLESLFVC